MALFGLRVGIQLKIVGIRILCLRFAFFVIKKHGVNSIRFRDGYLIPKIAFQLLN